MNFNVISDEDIQYFGKKNYIYRSIENFFYNKDNKIRDELFRNAYFVTILNHSGEIDKMGFPIFPINPNSNKTPYEYLLIDFEKKLPSSLEKFNSYSDELFLDMITSFCNESLN